MTIPLEKSLIARWLFQRQESRVFISGNGLSWQQSATLPASDLPVIQRVYFGGGVFLARSAIRRARQGSTGW
jgi:hypothetical protein